MKIPCCILFSLLCLTSVRADLYTVQKSDTLSKIARKHNTSAESLARYNGISLKGFLQIGQKIKLPPTYRTHVVRSGETLGAIATKHKTTTRTLVSFNSLPDPNALSVGQKVRIPLGGGSSTPLKVVKNYPRLSSSTSRALGATRTNRYKWKYIVVHHSASSQGSAKSIDRYHREERRMQNGLAYHFVIGNGRGGMGDGEIAIGHRWKRQIKGGHLASEALNEKCIGICLIGNFQETVPSKKQWDSLEALSRYLLGVTHLRTSAIRSHQAINTKPTACPGRHLNIESFKRTRLSL